MKKLIVIFVLVFVITGCQQINDVVNNFAQNPTATSQPQTKSIASDQACEPVWQNWLAKYGQDYKSCLQEVNIANNCQKPEGYDESKKTRTHCG